jgi:hypothetical protein
MAKATKRNSTRKRTTSKKPPQKTASSSRSEIIKQSIVYVQSVAAYLAGCRAEGANCELSGADGLLGAGLLKNSYHALEKLIELSQARAAAKQTLSVAEMRAKAAVCKEMMDFESGNALESVHEDYIRLFAEEVVIYFKKALSAAERGGGHAQAG